ncbi:MAG: MotA/TolQ/ExbB proton channel family protein [SAR324 cluster bacterium]|nr:MotA/TolQ/ExbB proton channel family protein [SAR324 cluster bacterium]
MAEGAIDNGSIWSLIFTGNWIAFGILAILMIMSAISWAVIIIKWLQFRQMRAENSHFYNYFRGDHPLSDILVMAQKYETSSLARMCAAGYQEISAFRKSMENVKVVSDARERLLASLSRRLESVYNQQNELMERRLPLLATVSSSSPYIGLFGTVLGIIDAFRSIATMGVTSLAVVAPGISEALVATAAGLMAAIPALIAYNMYRNRLRELNTELKNFALEMTNRMERTL